MDKPTLKTRIVAIVIFSFVIVGLNLAIKYLPAFILKYQFASVMLATILVATVVGIKTWDSMPPVSVICGGATIFAAILLAFNLNQISYDKEKEAYAATHPPTPSSNSARFDAWRASPEREKYVRLVSTCQSMGGTYSHCKELVSRESGIYPPK